MHSLKSFYHRKVELLDSFIKYDIDHFPFNSMIKRMERWESCICQKLCKFFALNFVWQNVESSDDVSRISQNFDRRKTWLCCVIEEGKLFILLQKVWERFVTCEGILQQQWLLRHFLQLLFIRVLFATTIPKFAMKISGSHIENLFAIVWARVRLWGWPSLITLNGT